MLISNCKLDKTELLRVHTLAAEERFADKAVQKLRQESLICPKPWTEAAMQLSIAASLLPPPSLDSVPPSAKQICRARDTFSEAVFFVPMPGGAKWFRFLFAMLNPVALFLMEVTEEGSPHASPSTARDVSEGLRNADVQWSWVFLTGSFMSASVFQGVELKDVGVVMRSKFLSSRHLDT